MAESNNNRREIILRMKNMNISLSSYDSMSPSALIKKENTIDAKYYVNRDFSNEKKKFRTNNAIKSLQNYCIKYYKPSKSCMRDYFFKRFPILEWLTKYDYKNNGLNDFISGLTIGKKS